MTLEQLLDEWTKDSIVDKTELADESLRVISLIAKYMRWYKEEKLKLFKLQKEYKKLYLAKYEFYTQGPSKETQELGWEMPAKGAIIKNEAQMYIDADKDITNSNLKIAMQQEKADLLYDIVKELNNRRWSIRAAIDFIKWTQGG